MKKMENAHEIEKRNIKTKVKTQAKEKYNFRLEELKKKFKKDTSSMVEENFILLSCLRT